MRRTLALAVAATILLPASASAATVSGTLAGGRGYTVIALSRTGESTKVTAGAGGRFSLKVPGRDATLQLVKPNGSYFGPVVLRSSGREGLVGLSGKSGKLGRMALKRGYATAKAPQPAVSSGAIRITKAGAPLGAGNLGFVQMKGKARASAASVGADKSAPGADPDGDGVPSTFDADDNGNKTLDGVDPVTAKTDTAGLFSDVQVMMARSVNANAGGISTAQVDEFVMNNTSLNFYLDGAAARGASISSVDVDCGALVYCRPGDGRSTMGDGGNSPTGVQDQPWITLDDNHDGLPDVPLNRNGNGGGGGQPVHSIEIKPNVTTADLHPGDTYQIRYTTPGGVLTAPTALSFYFVSNPALATFDGGAGPQQITYRPDGSTAGSDQNPLRMTGDKIALTFWRPQRAGLGGEPKFMDMGHLRYGIPIALDGREIGCGAGAFSELSPTLAPAAGTSGPYNQLFPLQDSADDAAPSPARTLSLTLDVGACLRAHGVDPTGQQVRLPLEAVTESRPGGTDRTAQTIAVCLPGCTPPASGGPAGGNTDGGPTNSEHPDLSIASVTGTDAGGDCQLTIQIANRGTAMSAPSDTRIQAGGGASSTDSTVTTQSIPAGGSEATVTTIPGSCAGRTFTVTADSAGSIAELDEANNAWTGGA